MAKEPTNKRPMFSRVIKTSDIPKKELDTPREGFGSSSFEFEEPRSTKEEVGLVFWVTSKGGVSEGGGSKKIKLEVVGGGLEKGF